jgi:anti-anti-sigma factor
MMKLAVETASAHRDRPLVVKVAGDMDAAGAAVLLDVVKAAVDLGHVHLVLDVDSVKVIDRNGAAAISELERLVLEKGGSMQLVQDSPELRAAFAVMGFRAQRLRMKRQQLLRLK